MFRIATLVLPALLGILAAAQPLAAQDSAPLEITHVGWPVDRFLSNRSVLNLWLSRPPAANERVAMVIGGMDVSALLDRTGNLVRYRPDPIRLPSGEVEVVVYAVDASGSWAELGRHPLKIRGPIGLDRATATPALDLSSSGMLTQNASDPPPERTTFQDLVGRLGVTLAGAGPGYTLAAHANLQGVSNGAQRLRRAALGPDAPAVDLSDYRIGAAFGAAEVALGAVSVGGNRFLLNGFGSRGLQAGLRMGPALRLDLGLVGGASMVGWSNLSGVADPEHRIGLASLGLQMMPSRPGALQVEVTAVDGSVRPVAGFNQGAATDAETSQGFGVTVAASDLRQRVRFAAGVSRSRFTNPADPLLFRDSAIVAVRPETRQARFGELALRLLDGVALSPRMAASLGVTARHERVDPLYRSVGAFVAADQESNGLEFAGNLGALSVQGAATAARDNLGAVASILTTKTRSTVWSASAPLAALVGAAPAWYWPAATFAWQRTRQFGDGTPVGGDFQPIHIPDQVSINRTGGLSWTIGSAALGYRWNRSTQDNRQVGRERADFRTDVHGVSLTVPAVRAFTLGLEAGLERNRSEELDLTQQVERLGANLQWQLSGRAAFSGAVSQTWSEDPRSDQRLRNTEMYGELSRGFNLYGRPSGGTQGRLFVRYHRTRMALASLSVGDPFQPVLTWAVTAGSSLRVF